MTKTKNDRNKKALDKAKFKQYNAKEEIKKRYHQMTKDVINLGKELRGAWIEARVREEMYYMKVEQLKNGIKENLNGMIKTEGLIKAEAVDLQDSVKSFVMSINKSKEKLLEYQDHKGNSLLSEKDIEDIQFGNFDYEKFNNDRNIEDMKLNEKITEKIL